MGERGLPQAVAMASFRPSSTSAWKLASVCPAGTAVRTLMPRIQATTARRARSSLASGGVQAKSSVKLSSMRASALSSLSSRHGSPGMGTGEADTSAWRSST
ncbi:hypothetical protein DBR42_17755 [Pelomonas sp. HMWF004]|nr:hypothetical protein DBR42_17755 [Pelomonas sp. HMWF004]